MAGPSRHSSGTERRLAAIMFTDIVGYTALMAESEETGRRVRQRHAELLRPLVERYHGEWVQNIGDETLSSFQSAVDAVNCALAIQTVLQEEPDLRIRIGIHIGDIVFEEGSLHGDGVNIAARIRPLADPGGICVSDEVQHAIRSQPDIDTMPLGEHELKNVGRPVSVFAVGRPGSLMNGRRVGGRLWNRLFVGTAIVLVSVAAGAYLLRRPLLRIYVPYVMSSASPGYEQEIAFTTTRDGVRIAYAAVGNGPPLLIVPGWFSHLERGLGSPIFDELTPLLRDRHRVIRYDGRGFGLSDRGVPDLSLEGRVRDIEAVVDALGLEQFALFAGSAGGPPAIVYAARYPERVTRIAFYGTFAELGGDPDVSAQWKALAAIVRTGWGQDRAAVRQMFTLLLTPEADEIALQALNEIQRISANPDDAAFFVGEIGRIDVREFALQIRAPALVMHVEGDQAVPFDAGRRLASLIPDARFLPLPGVNHMPLPDDEALQLQHDALKEWLAEDLPRSRNYPGAS